MEIIDVSTEFGSFANVEYELISSNVKVNERTLIKRYSTTFVLKPQAKDYNHMVTAIAQSKMLVKRIVLIFDPKVDRKSQNVPIENYGDNQEKQTITITTPVKFPEKME